MTPIPAKPRQPRGKSHPSLQCHNWPDWVADGAVWSYPVSAKGGPAFGGNPHKENSWEVQEFSSFATFATLDTKRLYYRGSFSVIICEIAAKSRHFSLRCPPNRRQLYNRSILLGYNLFSSAIYSAACDDARSILLCPDGCFRSQVLVAAA